MNNRPPAPPIFFALALGVCLAPGLIWAEPGVPSAELTNPGETSAPDSTAESTSPAPATTYTAEAGDSLASIAEKFHCSLKKLKKLNHLLSNRVKPGHVLQLPPTSSGNAAPALVVVSHHDLPHPTAQPVQDFDLPASTFASCPVPPGSTLDSDTLSIEPPESSVPASASPRAQLVGPSEFEAAPVAKPLPKVAAIPIKPAPKPIPVVSNFTANHDTNSSAGDFGDTNTSPAIPTPVPASPSTKQAGRSFFFSSQPPVPSGDEVQVRFLQAARDLGDRGISYDQRWRPPGESQSWVMDCSNTARYLYRVAAGIELPRTASDQYFYLHLQNKAWDVPQTASGYADCQFLRENLKPGDLLFWENTYRPERQPPITHVMVFLGSNDRGQWIMGGSQSTRGGEHNRRNGGPDVYIFDPLKPSGGYTTWLGFVHHKGRFCAYGRPLEADPSKLSVAEN